MTWKTSAIAWSGMTVLASWLASGPAAPTPGSGPSTAGTKPTAQATGQATDAPAARTRAPKVDLGVEVAAQAARLHAGLQPRPAFDAPTRNPFRFREAVARTRAPQAPAVPTPDVDSMAASTGAPTASLTLAGIAEETEGQAAGRTAVISAPGDVVLAKEGDVVAGYRVMRIGGDHVELKREADGAALRLALRP